jgi:glycosyltransferase involved in cell wall biosynthesis
MPAEAKTVLHVFPTFAVGGAQVRFAALANRFGRSWRHLVVALDGEYGCRDRLSPDLDVRFPAVVAAKSATLGNVRRFRRHLREWQPDLLVTNNWGSIEWAMANLPALARHLHIEDGFGPEERTTQLPRRVWTRRLVLARSTVALPSRTLWRIATETWRLNPRHVFYVPNGIDLGRFPGHRDAAMAAGFPGDGPVIGTVAALRAEKNLKRLLQAFQLVTQQVPARLVIVGDGAERATLQELSGRLGLADRVRFTGHIGDPASLYAGFDLFALSSDTEQMPLSVIEAMAAALPVATTDVGDVRAMLAPENAPFVAPLDAAALADSMLRLLRDPARARLVGHANRAKAASDFDQARMFAAYDALWAGRAPPIVAA